MGIETESLFRRVGAFVDEVMPAASLLRTERSRSKLKPPTSGPKFWFLLLVALPTLIAFSYYYAIASDIYLSQAQFIVKAPDKPHGNGAVEKMLQSGAASDEQTYVVKDYIMSRHALKLLEQQDDIRHVFDRPGADFLTRFPRPFGGVSFEHLFRAYERFVDVTIDEDSGIATLKVKAFTPEDAHRIAESLVRYSELLINRMNMRAEQDAVSLAHREVDQSEERVIETQTALTAFRNDSMQIDPSASSGHMLTLVSQLTGNEAMLEARLTDVEHSAPGSPQIPALKSEIGAMQGQIDAMNRKLAGGNRSITPQLSAYEQLQLKRTFAEKELDNSMESLQTARIDAERQHIYLERIGDPMTPDYALYPKRLKSVAIIFISSLIIFSLGWLLVAGAREHVS